MKNTIFFISFLLLFYAVSLAQYTGGNGDGYTEELYAETTLNNESISLLYLGSNGDGYSENVLHTVTLENLPIAQLYIGGNGDGFDSNLKSDTNLENISLAQLYLGSNGDGYSEDLLSETNLNNLSFEQLYSGSNGDGYSVDLLSETSLTNLDLTILYLGNNGDGYAQNLFEQTTLNNLSLALLYSGSNGDGYSNDLLASTTLSNISLAILFGGGNGDGFSKSNYYQNPLCDSVISIWNAGTWSNGFPTNITQVIIDDTYDTNIQGNLSACSCTVRNGNLLTVRGNNYVRVVNNIVNNGNFDILHQGSLVQNNNNATVTGNGTFTTRIETTPLLDQHRFTYFSSPTESQDLTVFNSFADMNRLWRFDETIQDWYQVPSTTNMTPAIGFAIQGAPDVGQYPQIGNANFDGPFNNGIFSYPLTFNPGGIDDDNSLVGNPYPSAINASLLLNNNANANAFYFWTHNSVLLSSGYAGDDYAVWNNSGGIASGSGSPAPTGFIASGQGFFVDAVGPGNLVFNNSIRVTGNNNDFRDPITDLRDRIWLNLTSDDGHFNQLLINFTENGTIGFDAKLDATRFNTENPISFYSNGLNQEFFAIQALPILSEDNVIPLGYDAIDESIIQLKISIDHLENFNDVDIYLKDYVLNVIHDLELSDYSFNPIINSDSNFTNENRFELIFKRTALSTENDVINTENLTVSNLSENEIEVSTINGSIITEFKAYDTLGKLVIDVAPKQNRFIIKTQLNQGIVLFIKAKLVNDTILNTKFIKL